MPASGYTVITFVADELLTSTKMNQMGANDAAFNNGNGFNDSIIVARHIASNIITSSKIDWAASTGKIWWEELGRATAAGPVTSLSIPSIPAKKYLRIILLQHSGGSVAITAGLRFNNDSGANYQYHTNENGVESSGGSQTFFQLGINALLGMHFDMFLVNEASYHKVGSAIENFWDAGTIYRNTYAAKWNNASAQITRVDLVTSTGAFQAGSELIVLGHN